MTSATINSDSVEIVDKLSQMSNTYGFMTVFSVIILLLIVIFFINWQRNSTKKQQAEIELFENERSSSINQNQKMFDLVTKVQTGQLVQLQKMTDTLVNVSSDVEKNAERIISANNTIKDIQMSCKEHIIKDDSIIDMLGEILEYVRTSDNCNKEILVKVEKIENKLIKDQHTIK